MRREWLQGAWLQQAAIINKRKFCMWRVNANRQTHTHTPAQQRGRRAVENVKLMHKVYSNNNSSSKNDNDNDNMQIKSQNAAREMKMRVNNTLATLIKTGNSWGW